MASGQGEVMIRLVASFATTDDHVDQFLEVAQRAQAAQARGRSRRCDSPPFL